MAAVHADILIEAASLCNVTDPVAGKDAPRRMTNEGKAVLRTQKCVTAETGVFDEAITRGDLTDPMS